MRPVSGVTLATTPQQPSVPVHPYLAQPSLSWIPDPRTARLRLTASVRGPRLANNPDVIVVMLRLILLWSENGSQYISVLAPRPASRPPVTHSLFPSYVCPSVSHYDLCMCSPTSATPVVGLASRSSHYRVEAAETNVGFQIRRNRSALDQLKRKNERHG